MLAGLPLPDIRAHPRAPSTTGPPTSPPSRRATREFGGYLKRAARSTAASPRPLLKGPENPILKQEEAALKAKKKAGAPAPTRRRRASTSWPTGKDINVPMKVRWSEGSGQADIEIQGTKLTLKAGDWSAWVPLTFKFNAARAASTA